jgi:RHS repeat-associated protein
VVADSSGNVVKRIEYDSFGNILADTDPTLEVPFGFAGGLHDRDTGLVRFGFRDYDPDTSRWTAKDPIGFAGGNIDLYSYCLNDPINWVDPRGLVVEADPYGLGPGAFYKAGAALITTGTTVTGLGVVIMAAGGPVGWIGGGVVTIVGGTIWASGVAAVYLGYRVGVELDQQLQRQPCLQEDLSSMSSWGAGIDLAY